VAQAPLSVGTRRIVGPRFVGAALAAACSAWACAGHPPADLARIPSLVAPATSATPAPTGSATPRARPIEDARPTAQGRPVGSKIEVEWHGRYYAATVLGTTPEGKTRIHYDGYGDEWDEDVGEERIREPTTGEDPLD
jgi:hypothetical protein